MKIILKWDAINKYVIGKNTKPVLLDVFVFCSANYHFHFIG